MRVTKLRKADTTYGDRAAMFHVPAVYAVLNDAGAKAGEIRGSTTGYMERTSWELWWFDSNGSPRTVKYFDSYKAAKAWAETWDGLPPERFR